MRVILVMIEPPLPFGSAASRWFYVLLRGLVERGHEVKAFATCSNSQDVSLARELFPSSRYDLRCYAHRAGAGVFGKLRSFARPMSYMFSDELKRDLEMELARGYSVLHFEQLWGAWLAPTPPQRTLANVHYLFDIDQRERWMGPSGGRLVHRRILQAERTLLGRLENIAALTPRLSGRIAQINPTARVFTMPLGIDTSLYPFAPQRDHDRPTVGLIGSFDWGPTHSAGVRLVHRLWPQIKQRVPRARLLLVGRNVERALGIQSSDDVLVRQDVPDALPYFGELDAMVYAPAVGSGMKIKVLESFALGAPVVTNEEGIEGIDAIDGVHCGLAEDDTGMIDRAVRLLTDRDLREQYRSAARALVEAKYDRDAPLDRVASIYAAIATEPSPRIRAIPV